MAVSSERIFSFDPRISEKEKVCTPPKFIHPKGVETTKGNVTKPVCTLPKPDSGADLRRVASLEWRRYGQDIGALQESHRKRA